MTWENQDPKDVRKKSVLHKVGAFLVLATINLLGGFALAEITRRNLDWYHHLAQPSFAPPNWLFAPVWTILYALMAFASWKVYCKGRLTGNCLAAYCTQLALNFMWTPMFFGFHQLFIALIVSSLMWIAILWTILSFNQVDQLAAIALVPYLLWVSFATVLNGALWYLNHKQYGFGGDGMNFA